MFWLYFVFGGLTVATAMVAFRSLGVSKDVMSRPGRWVEGHVPTMAIVLGIWIIGGIIFCYLGMNVLRMGISINIALYMGGILLLMAISLVCSQYVFKGESEGRQ